MRWLSRVPPPSWVPTSLVRQSTLYKEILWSIPTPPWSFLSLWMESSTTPSSKGMYETGRLCCKCVTGGRGRGREIHWWHLLCMRIAKWGPRRWQSICLKVTMVIWLHALPIKEEISVQKFSKVINFFFLYHSVSPGSRRIFTSHTVHVLIS